MIKKIIGLAITASLLLGEETRQFKSVNDITSEERTELKAPLFNLLNSTAFPVFLKELEVTLKVGICGDELKDKALGFRTAMIEPYGYIETSNKPLFFPFAKLDLGGNIIKTEPARNNDVDEAGRTASYYTHFIYAPILGMLIKKQVKFLCISGGSLIIPVLSEFDPTKNNDLLSSKVFINMVIMMSPVTMVASILDCGATASYSMIKGYSTGDIGDDTTTWDSSSWQDSYQDPENKNTHATTMKDMKSKGLEKLAFIRNSLYMNLGCQGFFNVADAVDGIDPIMDASMLSYTVASKMHGASTISQIPLLQKTTEFPGYPSTLCKPLDYPLSGIESQTVLNIAYPLPGSGKEQGEIPLNLSSFKNVPQSKDSTVYVFWQRKDILAGAYHCKNKMDNGGNK